MILIIELFQYELPWTVQQGFLPTGPRPPRRNPEDYLPNATVRNVFVT